MADARDLSDRELMILTHSKVMDIEDILVGPDGLKRRLAKLETIVDERTVAKPPATVLYGLPAGVASAAVLLWEVAKHKLGVE